MNQVISEVFAPAAVDAATRQRMFALMGQVYEGVDRSDFERDLDEKDFVILSTCADAVVGFTTGAVRGAIVAGSPIRYVFSGDTVINPDYWGPGHFFATWFKLMGRIKADDPELPLHWFLITKGHRTYRFMTSFFRSYVPCLRGVEDEQLLRVRETLGREKFGDYYDATTGLADFGMSKGHLAPSLQDAAELAKGNPLIRDFIRLNPDHERGVELVCIAELAEHNLRSFATHRFTEGLSEGRGALLQAFESETPASAERAAGGS